jgi:hypothetical protein
MRPVTQVQRALNSVIPGLQRGPSGEFKGELLVLAGLDSSIPALNAPIPPHGMLLHLWILLK